MIATLSGVIAEHIGGEVVLDVQGVGYGVVVAQSDAAVLRNGEQAKLYIYEHIKEDAHTLFGFSSLEAKGLFEQLLSVKNVGPKVAMSVLDIGSTNDVRAAIASGDVKRLQTAKGVGKRAAEQMVVELRDKIGAPVGSGAEAIVGRAGVDMQDEAIMALVSLGYSEADAALALQGIDTTLPTEDRIRQALSGSPK